MEKGKDKIAVLIDGDNAQAKLLDQILEEISKYGKATIRRIYGDWTTPQMNSWKESINQYSFSPIQKFSYTTGKNSTDSSLIIDAMDILHSKTVDGFCIVSSDSDYTGLAKRIREEGIFVMGIGEKKTPQAFVQSCEVFTFSENINPAFEEKELMKSDNNPDAQKKVIKKQKVDPRFLKKAFNIASGEDDEVYISQVGLALRKLDPTFDPRAFGFRNLTEMFKSLKQYEVIDNKKDGLNHPLIREKNNRTYIESDL